MTKHLEIFELKPGERKHFMELLLLADESESIIESYMYEGDMFQINFDNKLIGVIQFVFHSVKKLEIKNFALIPDSQGKGIGREVIKRMVEHYRDKGYKIMIVGTANSSIGNIVFYQKAGFRITDVLKNYFSAYPKTIVENGILAMDMIMFERELNES